MFMMEKALVVMIFLYAPGFSLLAGQYVIGDVYNITLVSPVTGQPIKSSLLSFINLSNVNTIEQNVTSTTRGSVVTNINSFLGMVWELVLLLTGTYIFNILYLLGVPAIAIVGMVAIYFFLLIRAYFGYIRGI